jgi:hypothetical protein
MSIHLHIERLILDGLPVGNHQAGLVRTAVEAELTRLLEVEGLGSSASWGLMPQAAEAYAPAGTLQLADNAPPTAVGTGIARVVHGSLSRAVRWT